MASAKTHPAAQPDWNNLEVLHRNTLPPRSHFYVYESVDDALSYDLTKSRTQLLSGSWKFNWAANPFEAPEGFADPAFDAAGWDDVAVPSMWQLGGYGKGPQYSNVNFPIPVDPPNAPLDQNETGSYVRSFAVDQRLRGSQLRLRFEGVDSAFHVWVNGRQVGYSQGSRNPSEFDITGFVDEQGENTLAVRVYQYCDGTYIEDQDQWRMSGIFRDVYLLGFPQALRIEDVFVQTKLDENYRDAVLNARVDIAGSGKLRFELYDATKTSLLVEDAREVSGGPVHLSFPVVNPLKWTAETPNLYHMVLSLDNKTHVARRVGFRQVEMKDGLLQVNGKRIVFKGANRHEHHPRFGRAVPYDFLRQDLLLMKTHNLNAIRTCHQPSDVRLYDLADELGLWVMDEADLECHGFETICDAALSPADRALPFRERQLITREEAAKWTSDNPAWEKAYLDRAVQMVRRDQVHPSVVVWSLGNESFFGRNHVAMYDWIKAYDDSRPVHYEADIHADTMDMYSRMYPDVEEIVAFGKDASGGDKKKMKNKPLVLCEYIHAMGNGPGNIHEYVDAFYDHPSLQGGFVWEWANHGLAARDRRTGEEYMAYGGDFGDEPNDGSFVMDGTLFSDHTPTPGLAEYKKSLEPVRLVEWTAREATFANRFAFLELDHLECEYLILDDGRPTPQCGQIDIPASALPGHRAGLRLPVVSTPVSGEAIVRLSFRQKAESPSLPAGFEVAFAEIPITPGPNPLSLPPSPSPSGSTTGTTGLKVTETPSLLTIEAGPTVWTFAPARGRLESLSKGGVPFLARGPEFSAYRAPTDNDAPQDGRDWRDRLLHLAAPHTQSCTWGPAGEEEEGGGGAGSGPAAFRVAVRQRFAPPALSWSIDLELTYTFHASGLLAVRVRGRPRGQNLPATLPRVGLGMELPAAWAGKSSGSGSGSNGGSGSGSGSGAHHPPAVQWYGRGPGESYADKKLSQRTGVYGVRAVDDLWVDYEHPQEGGNRTDTRWVRFSTGGGGEGDGEEEEEEAQAVTSITAQFVDLTADGGGEDNEGGSKTKASRKLFDFNASHYRAADVEAARHPHELRRKKLDGVVLRLDAAHHGLGSGSCGPKTLDQYALKCEPFEFEVLLH